MRYSSPIVGLLCFLASSGAQLHTESEEASNRKLQIGECRTVRRKVDYLGVRHGDYISEYNGIKIQAIPDNGSDKCFAPSGAARLMVTGNPLYKCDPGQGNPALGSTAGRAITLQQGPNPGTRCVDDCAYGGQFVFTFPTQVRVRSIQVINMDIPAEPSRVIVRSRNERGQVSTRSIPIPLNNNGDFVEQVINADAFEIAVAFTNGGAVSTIKYDICEEDDTNDGKTTIINPPATEDDPSCQNLIRSGRMENALETMGVWSGRNHVVGVFPSGFGSSAASLRSLPRPRSFLGPEQRISRAKRRCISPGKVYSLSAQVRLLDTARRGANCLVSGPIEAPNRIRGNNLCPAFQIKIRDNSGHVQILNFREYENRWVSEEWNHLEGTFVAPRVSGNWDGNVGAMRVRIASMDSALTLLVDNVSIQPQ